MKYRKTAIVEAFQWVDGEDRMKFPGWLNAALASKDLMVPDSASIMTSPLRMVIHTMEGILTVTPGDWVIKGIHGELYPCKPDIFEKTYELVPEPTEPKEDFFPQTMVIAKYNGVELAFNLSQTHLDNPDILSDLVKTLHRKVKEAQK